MGRLTAVQVEAGDVGRVAGFWGRALGWRVEAEGDGSTAVVGPGPAGIALRVVASRRAKTAKNRLHLDLAGGPDQDAEVARLLELGAVRADIGQGDVPWDVLADPEGNEFCVLPDPGSAPGRLAAICLDAADAAAQGRFWTTATGWTVTEQGDWGVRLRPSARDDGPALVMGPPAAPKPGPNRLRFVLAPEAGTDPAAETAHLLAAGATAPDDRTLTDPEGNEFHLRARAGAGPGLPRNR